jgi:hypothetical protein
VVNRGEAKYQVWYDMLNSGFRITGVAGTDYPFSGQVPGRARFYTKLKGPFTYKAWLEGVRSGRTFSTNGPMLELRVDGREVGDEIELNRARSVLIEGSVRFDPSRDDVQSLQVIENGNVIKTIARDSGSSEILCRFEHQISDAGWLALRATGRKPDEVLSPVFWHPVQTVQEATSNAHTSPIYFSITDQPGRATHPRAKALAETWLDRLRELEDQLADENIEKLAKWPAFSDGVELDVLLRDRPALLQAIDAAKRYFIQQAR